MIYYILAVLCLSTLLGLVGVFGWQVRLNRQKNLDYSSLDDYGVIGLALDYLAFKIVRSCWNVLFKAYLFSVHFAKNCISTARFVIVKVERRFNRLAANMPEPEDIHKTDKVSFFLKEIKEHKENMMAEIQNGAIAEEIENR